jgi:hypothetical protein
MGKGKTKAKGAASKKAADEGKKKKKAVEDDPTTQIAKARAAAFTDERPANAFDHFRPLAEKVPTADLQPFSGQPLLMRANILKALEAMEPHLPAAVSALRDPRLSEIFELPSLVMGLEFAAGRVPIAKLSAGEIQNMLMEGGPWRELMLTYLEVVSHPLLGLLPRERVAAIRKGTGKLDQAQDFVAISGVFAEFEKALERKHPFPEDKIALLGTLGGTLVQNIRPGNAAVTIAKRSSEAILRDQFATMVVDRYDRLQVLAVVALGKRKADALLPALRSQVGQARTPGETEVGEPIAQADGAGR